MKKNSEHSLYAISPTIDYKEFYASYHKRRKPFIFFKEQYLPKININDNYNFNSLETNNKHFLHLPLLSPLKTNETYFPKLSPMNIRINNIKMQLKKKIQKNNRKLSIKYLDIINIDKNNKLLIYEINKISKFEEEISKHIYDPISKNKVLQELNIIETNTNEEIENLMNSTTNKAKEKILFFLQSQPKTIYLSAEEIFKEFNQKNNKIKENQIDNTKTKKESNIKKRKNDENIINGKYKDFLECAMRNIKRKIELRNQYNKEISIEYVENLLKNEIEKIKLILSLYISKKEVINEEFVTKENLKNKNKISVQINSSFKKLIKFGNYYNNLLRTYYMKNSNTRNTRNVNTQYSYFPSEININNRYNSENEYINGKVNKGESKKINKNNITKSIEENKILDLYKSSKNIFTLFKKFNEKSNADNNFNLKEDRIKNNINAKGKEYNGINNDNNERRTLYSIQENQPEKINKLNDSENYKLTIENEKIIPMNNKDILSLINKTSYNKKYEDLENKEINESNSNENNNNINFNNISNNNNNNNNNNNIKNILNNEENENLLYKKNKNNINYDNYNENENYSEDKEQISNDEYNYNNSYISEEEDEEEEYTSNYDNKYIDNKNLIYNELNNGSNYDDIYNKDKANNLSLTNEEDKININDNYNLINKQLNAFESQNLNENIDIKKTLKKNRAYRKKEKKKKLYEKSIKSPDNNEQKSSHNSKPKNSSQKKNKNYINNIYNKEELISSLAQKNIIRANNKNRIKKGNLNFNRKSKIIMGSLRKKIASPKKRRKSMLEEIEKKHKFLIKNFETIEKKEINNKRELSFQNTLNIDENSDEKKEVNIIKLHEDDMDQLLNYINEEEKRRIKIEKKKGKKIQNKEEKGENKISTNIYSLFKIKEKEKKKKNDDLTRDELVEKLKKDDWRIRQYIEDIIRAGLTIGNKHLNKQMKNKSILVFQGLNLGVFKFKKNFGIKEDIQLEPFRPLSHNKRNQENEEENDNNIINNYDKEKKEKERKERIEIAKKEKKEKERIEKEKEKERKKEMAKKNLIYDNSYLFPKKKSSMNFILRKEVEEILQGGILIQQKSKKEEENNESIRNRFLPKKRTKFVKKKKKRGKLFQKSIFLKDVVHSVNLPPNDNYSSSSSEIITKKEENNSFDEKMENFINRVKKLKKGEQLNYHEIEELIKNQKQGLEDKEKEKEIRMKEFINKLNEYRDMNKNNRKKKDIFSYKEPILIDNLIVNSNDINNYY